MIARRGDVWSIEGSHRVLVVSSTVYNEIPDEPTVLVVPVYGGEPATGFGVAVGGGWAAPGLIRSLRKSRLVERQGRADVQELTDVNNMLFRILATPEK